MDNTDLMLKNTHEENVPEYRTEQGEMNQQLDTEFQQANNQQLNVEEQININQQDVNVTAEVTASTQTMQLTEEVRAEAVNQAAARTIAQDLMSCESAKQDSKEMIAVKENVYRVEMLLQEENLIADKAFLDRLSGMYAQAIEACQYYCDNKHPFFNSGKIRKERVKTILETYKKEQDIIIRLAMQDEEKLVEKSGTVTKGLDWLQFEDAQTEIKYGRKDFMQEAIRKLRFEDFARVSGTGADGAIVLTPNRDLIVIDEDFPIDFETRAKYNIQIRNRFVVACATRLKEQGTWAEAQWLYETMEMDNIDESKPLTTEMVRKVLGIVAENAAEVDKLLKTAKGVENEEDLSIQERLAKRVDAMIGGNYQKLSRTRMDKNDKKILKAEMRKLVKEATSGLGEERKNEPFLAVSDRQIEMVVNNNISLLRENVFRDLNLLYRGLAHVNAGQATNTDAITDELIHRVILYNIASLTAQTTAGSEYVQYRKERYIIKNAFDHAGESQEAEQKIGTVEQKHWDNLSDRNLAYGSGDLDAIVKSKMHTVPEWEKNPTRVAEAVHSIKRLCANMEEIDRLKIKAFVEGLTDAEAEQMVLLAGEVVQEFRAHTDIQLGSGEIVKDEYRIVTDELKNTRYGFGMEGLWNKLRANESEDIGESYLYSVSEVARKMRCNNEHGAS
ncbi:MAG: hypothetical protein IJ040_07750 [Lachnospiraceae bacterium]|nr:hypothetical protein [Lachnospiraceae bacterium]